MLPGTEDGVTPFWSADSRSIGFFDSASRKLKKVDVSGGPPETVSDARVGGVAGAGGTWNLQNVILFGQAGGLFRVSAAGGVPTPVTTLDPSRQETAHSFPQFLPDGRHFLFLASSGRPENSAIYVGSLDSKDRTRVIAAQLKAEYVSSGSRGHLLFVRDRTLTKQPFDADTFRLTGDPSRVVETVDTISFGFSSGLAAFSLSKTGVLAYRSGVSSSNSRLVWFDRGGKQLDVLGDEAVYGDVKLSPDGTQAAVSVQDQTTSDIWRYDVARGNRTRFTFDPADEFAPVWSPDGSRIAFNSRRKGKLHLYQKLSTGAGTEEVLLEDDESKFPASWSADGKSILYVGNADSADEDLWVLPLSGDRKRIPFVKTPFREIGGQISPDGRWVAYASNEGGTFEVYVTPFSAPEIKWPVSTAGGRGPLWGRDGNELFFAGPPALTLTAVAVNGKGASFEIGEAKPLFDLPIPMFAGNSNTYRLRYDVTADGQRFLVNTISASASTSNQINVVLNWTSDLER